MDLSEKSLEHINQTKGFCPECEDGELQGGPTGGNSQNFRCVQCAQEFNLGLNQWGDPFVWMGERLNRRDSSWYDKAYLSQRWGRI
jgi:hypothetical protein